MNLAGLAIGHGEIGSAERGMRWCSRSFLDFTVGVRSREVYHGSSDRSWGICAISIHGPDQRQEDGDEDRTGASPVFLAIGGEIIHAAF